MGDEKDQSAQEAEFIEVPETTETTESPEKTEKIEAAEPQEESTEQATASEEETSEDQPKTSKKPFEEARRDWDGGRRRLEKRKWSQIRGELEKDPNLAISAVQAVATKKGFDVTSEDNKKQTELIAESFHEIQSRKSRISESEKSKFINAALTETLQEVGVDPFTSIGRTIGTELINRLGTNDPDVFTDPERVKQGVEAIKSDMENFFGIPKKASSIKSQMIQKAAVPKPVAGKTVESKPKLDPKAAKRQELVSKIPAWMRPRN